MSPGQERMAQALAVRSQRRAEGSVYAWPGILRAMVRGKTRTTAQLVEVSGAGTEAVRRTMVELEAQGLVRRGKQTFETGGWCRVWHWEGDV